MLNIRIAITGLQQLFYLTKKLIKIICNYYLVPKRFHFSSLNCECHIIIFLINLHLSVHALQIEDNILFTGMVLVKDDLPRFGHFVPRNLAL